MSLDNFIRLSDNLVVFEADFNNNQLPTSSVFDIETHKEEVKSMWHRIKQSCERCLADLEKAVMDKETSRAAQDIETVKEKYRKAYITYCRCTTNLSELAKTFSTPKNTETSSIPNIGFTLPPCELSTFNGDYMSWPTFRDMFTAVCIRNPKLSPVEKLFHLVQRTKGEAYDIVSKSPLTNEGFSVAWENLCARFENKRVLINIQLKTLLNLPSIKSESGSSLKILQRDINACISALKLYDVDVTSWNPIFVYICSNCLPDATLTLWEQSLTDKTSIPNWSDFDNFLTNRYRTLESVSEMRTSYDIPSSVSKVTSNTRKKNVQTFQTNVNQTKCKLCPEEFHPIRKCPRFLIMNHSEKFSEIKASNLCLNCFSSAHSVKNCKSKHCCFKCGKRHNTLLHRDSETSEKPKQNYSPISSGNQFTTKTLPTPFIPSSIQQSTSSQNGVVQSCFSSSSRSVLLGTAVINIIHLGVNYQARALIDSGSEGTFISERLFNRLELPCKRTHAKISGLNNTISADVQKECTMTLGSLVNNDIKLAVSALVVPHLANNLPSRTVNIQCLTDIPKLPLADPHFYESSKVDILLGGDILPSVMLSGCERHICGSLMAQETIFGWILTGPIPVSTSASTTSLSTFVSYFCEISLDREISKFWEVENVPKKSFRSQSDRYCEELYTRTTTRREDGRYIVSLPFKEGYPEKLNLGQSRTSSMAQFFRNERRLLRNPDFKIEYDNVLREYISLKHMTPINSPNPSECPGHYYLPHHAVIKSESTTTKVRVVFNASSPTSNKLSLNDILHTGPVLQNDLTILILKWRFFRYVFNGDIRQMYRQILINPAHAPFQCILYRSNINEPIQDFVLNTVTFGVNCAPYLAIRTILKLAEDIDHTYPLASNILRSYMYVDDALAGAHTISETIQARDELLEALKSAGFEMRKWTANSKQILAGLDSEHLLYEDFLNFDDRSSAKMLGIRWNALSDCFYFAISPFPDSCNYTKREVLSQISKLFDPAGWLAPIIIMAKIIMQKIWIDRTGWDDVICIEALQIWKLFQSSCHCINNIKLPRWIDFSPECTVQFHGFCDASEKAYAAAVYIRIQEGNTVTTHLLLSKTRVAPIKTLSIPRLELCGAALLAELLDATLSKLDVDKYSLFCWTDSTIVLSWLAKPPCFWNTFVANRVSKIAEVVEPSKWSHVNSECNPADLASRGVLPQDLIENKLWWNGPQWLIKQPENWRTSDISVNFEDTDLERKPVKVHFNYFNNFKDVLDRFSSFPKALRIIAYIYRFYFSTHPKFRSDYNKDSEVITTSEILFVRNQLIRVTQKVSYPKEYMSLSVNKSISHSSSLLSLNPFIDPEGIMRICGRLEMCNSLPYNERHPIILPYNCQFSRLLIKFIHLISLHGGNQLVLRLVRTNYWIPKVQNLIKTTIHTCKPCIIYKKKCQRQLMAALPPERCEISRPFAHTGLDFAGPFDIKNYAGRACLITKGYVCVFVCFSTKAVHLEATSDLSTPAFLAAFSRFVSRRGCPLHLHSDNGTTFVGASKVIAREFIQTSHQAITSNYSHQNIVWHFIPPGAPHMGGLWEAGVKSFKQHFQKIAKISKYTFEEFQTLLSKIEACLNSRPLSPMSHNPSDFAALTPAHFLVGSPLLAPIDPQINEPVLSIRNRWQKLKVIQQQFCNRWKNEYLKELHKRQKWKCPQENIKENTLVVIKEDNLPANCWRLGRITKVYHGSDLRVRVADVLTEKGTFTRPITKLVVLAEENSTSN